jgi:hypothetical protein
LPEQTDFSKASALRGVGGEGATKGGPPVSPLGPGPSAGRSFRSHTGTPRCALVWGCPNLTQTGSCCGCAPPPPPGGGGWHSETGPPPRGQGRGETGLSPSPPGLGGAGGRGTPPPGPYGRFTWNGSFALGLFHRAVALFSRQGPLVFFFSSPPPSWFQGGGWGGRRSGRRRAGGEPPVDRWFFFLVGWWVWHPRR